MPVPFETLIPYGIIIAMFGVTGAGLSKIKHMQNGGKRARRSLDQWDRQMMDRDRRLTGFLRGQTDSPMAPLGYELNNSWKLEKRIHRPGCLTGNVAAEEVHQNCLGSVVGIVAGDEMPDTKEL
ncbi:hypothetical protein P8C59_009275 [Phyllachora maydis]|uniref:NADH dehydrogenase [ubiquinone] 1 alpha subcomplex subunit 1 n=1 Tax=Phyllachora maydis TaxID=1825666 RepID=A0AAD9MJI6_9PEZI|nr:hypothetical protein P8C59_009275 [Phyllachora maydis]